MVVRFSDRSMNLKMSHILIGPVLLWRTFATLVGQHGSQMSTKHWTLQGFNLVPASWSSIDWWTVPAA